MATIKLTNDIKLDGTCINNFSYVGKIEINTIANEAGMKAIFGSNTSWTKLAEKMPVGENVFGNGKALGQTNSTKFGGVGVYQTGGPAPRQQVAENLFGNDISSSQPASTDFFYGTIGVPTKAQLDTNDYPYANTGLIMDSITINIWQRTA